MKNTVINILLLFAGISFLSQYVEAQSKTSYDVVCIGFYNLENLFDTINDVSLRNNEEFTPESAKQWTHARYHEKLGNMAFVISKIATDITPDGPALLGVSEIENRGVLEDLVKEDAIKDMNYAIVHYDSPDRRGVDVGLLYQPKYFTVTNSRSHRLTMETDTSFRSRDQLVVTGLVDGEEISVIVGHWPSRSGGEKRSRPKRNAAGLLCRHIVDSLLAINANAKIIVMGDLNDDPVNPSVKEHLRAKGKEKDLEEGDLFNPMFKLYKDGIGSLAYRDAWNMFDQVIVSQGLLGEDKSGFKYYKAKVYNKNFLKQKEGAYAGYPWRTFAGGRYIGGYSDHFPVYVFLIREAN
ncbi:MAG: endonuclease/exonuclease/phosphatase family protein [Bacteroidales bacterium]|nr:endonuclease/exonuclease/phosphatase family protein [Bacteroidales bacterium]